jgi:tetratricopeptide (TPR) repeat protein
MSRRMVLGLVAVLVFGSAAAASESIPSDDAGAAPVTDIAPATDAAPSTDAIREMLQDAFKKLQNDDRHGTRLLFEGVVASPEFRSLTPTERYSAQFGLGLARYGDGDASAALAPLKQVTDTPYADGTTWMVYADAALAAGNKSQAIASLTTLARRWPATLSDQPDDVMVAFLRTALEPAVGDGERFNLIDALNDTDWTPKNPFYSLDNIELGQVRDLLTRRQIDKARKTASRIANTRVLFSMRINKTFDAVTSADSDRFDIARATASDLTRLQAASAKSPDLLAGYAAVSFALLERGRPADALATIDPALARIPADPKAKSPFSDPDKINWAKDRRAHALLRLGRTEEAIAMMKAAAEDAEDGRPNVSQRYNLAGFYEIQGRPMDALAVLKDVKAGEASPFGQMVVAEIRACAYAQLHQDGPMREAYGYVKEHASDAPDGPIEVALCIGDLDEAAKDLIQELGDPKRQDGALATVQEWLEPAVMSDHEREEHQRLKMLRARPDVQAALAKVGRMESLPIWSQSDL